MPHTMLGTLSLDDYAERLDAYWSLLGIKYSGEMDFNRCCELLLSGSASSLALLLMDMSGKVALDEGLRCRCRESVLRSRFASLLAVFCLPNADEFRRRCVETACANSLYALALYLDGFDLPGDLMKLALYRSLAGRLSAVYVLRYLEDELPFGWLEIARGSLSGGPGWSEDEVVEFVNDWLCMFRFVVMAFAGRDWNRLSGYLGLS